MELFDWEKNSNDVGCAYNSNKFYPISRSYFDKEDLEYKVACLVWVKKDTDKAFASVIIDRSRNKRGKVTVDKLNAPMSPLLECLKMDIKLKELGFSYKKLGM